MGSITTDPPIAMTHRSGNARTCTSQKLWLLRRTSHSALETGQRSAAQVGRRRATSIWEVRGLACRDRERKVHARILFKTRHAGKVVAPSNAAREPGVSCNQQENIMPTRKSGARGPAR